jgi:glycosyltransferase involved in cell wall biosynthesis
MNIAIDAHLLNTASTYRSAGVSNYSRRLIEALGHLSAAGETAHRFTAFVNAADFAASGITLRHGSARLADPLARIAWEQSVLPLTLRRKRFDLVHGLVNVLPLLGSTPGVVTVHDLSFLRMPEKFPAAKRIYLTRLCAASVRRAKRVIAVSRQTADDLMRFFAAPASKIRVVHNGVDARFAPAPAQDAPAFRRAKGLPDRYLLYLGTLEPRKNLDLLVRAFAEWRARAGTAAGEVKLVLAGAKGWFYEEIFRRVRELGLDQATIFPGFVAEDELPRWYQAATGFVYPSLFEGFGLPVLEAMACGTPVLCSRAPSLLEVAGDAALTAPAEDVAAWAAALTLLLEQPNLREQLSRRGVERARGFRWDAAARATIEVYEAAA